jgi:hypothetical protein
MARAERAPSGAVATDLIAGRARLTGASRDEVR